MSFKKHDNYVRAAELDALRYPRQITDETILDILQSFDTPRSLAVWLLYKHKEHAQLVELDIDPLQYHDAFRFRDDYQATLLLSKAKFLKTGYDLKQRALDKFRKCEASVRAVNDRFSDLAFDASFKTSNVSLLTAMTRKIHKILSSAERDGLPDIKKILDYGNWGPGVTTTLRGNHVSAYNKFRDERGITHSCSQLMGPIFHLAYPLWSRHLTDQLTAGREHCFDYQFGSRITTVPKNSKIDRVIAIEPGINLWFQKAIGTVIRRALRKDGINLNSQFRNQQLARKGSVTGSLATVDFSSASDTISRELVRELLPRPWYTLLDACRSQFGIIDEKLVTWEKFSSMGNGFTFELESMIFYAAAIAVCEYLHLDSSDVSVYGDDVILPADAYDLYRSFTEFLGFTINPDKSFSSGQFRESCGVHYWNGVCVKPFYLKEKISNVAAIYHVANSVRNLAHRRNSHRGCDVRFKRCWRRLVKRIPPSFQLGVCASLGDVGLSMNFDEACPTRARHGLEGYVTLARVVRPYEGIGNGTGLLLTRLWTSTDIANGNSYSLRGRTRSVLQSVLVPQWYDYGDWY